MSVVALGFIGTISFYRRGFIDWRKRDWLAVFVALGIIAGSFVAIEFSEAILNTVVITGLLLVLGPLLVRLSR